MSIKNCAYCGRKINTLADSYYMCKDPLKAELFIKTDNVENAFCSESCVIKKFNIVRTKDKKPYYYCRTKCDGECSICETRPLLRLCNELKINVKDMVNILCQNLTSKHEIFASGTFPKEFYASEMMKKTLLVWLQENWSLEDIVSSDTYISYYLSNFNDINNVTIFSYLDLTFITDGYLIYRIDDYFAKFLRAKGIKRELPNEAIARIRDIYFRKIPGTIRLAQLEKSISVETALTQGVLVFSNFSIVGKADTPLFYTFETRYLQLIKVRVSLAGKKRDPSLVKEHIDEIKEVAIQKIENHRSFKKYGVPIGIFAITNIALLSTWQVELTFEVKKELLDK